MFTVFSILLVMTISSIYQPQPELYGIIDIVNEQFSDEIKKAKNSIVYKANVRNDNQDDSFEEDTN